MHHPVGMRVRQRVRDLAAEAQVPDSADKAPSASSALSDWPSTSSMAM